MIDQLVQQFSQAYEQKGVRLITDNYVLKSGAYVRLDDEGNIQTVKVYNSKDGHLADKEYAWFAMRDYYSLILNTNKALDLPARKIHSNNYLTLFMKKKHLMGKDALKKHQLLDSIEKYYISLEDPIQKYNSEKKSLELYHTLAVPVDSDKVKINKAIILDKLDTILAELEGVDFSNYIKLFFDAPSELYQQEGRRYFIPNLYNKNAYNKTIDGKIYGLTNNNMGLNSKKPYLEHKTRDNTIPYFVESRQILMHKYFFDWLGTRKSGPLYIKGDSDFVEGISDQRAYGQKGYHYIQLEQGMAPTIIDYSFVPFVEKEAPLIVTNVQRVSHRSGEERQLMEDYILEEPFMIEKKLDQLIFQGRLHYVYYQEASDITKINPTMKQFLLASREGFKQYFRLGQKNGLRSALEILPHAICQRLHDKDYPKWKAAEAMNLYIALISQKGGDEDMAGKILQLRKMLSTKLAEPVTQDCDTDDEFYYLSGQIISYMLDRSKSQSTKHSMANMFLETKRPAQLIKEIRFAFMKYNHDISRNYRKFNNAMAMIQAYTCTDNKVDVKMLLTGYTASNLFYEKVGGNADE